MKDFDQALADANKVIEIKPDWPKGYTRKAGALHGQGDLRMYLPVLDRLHGTFGLTLYSSGRLRCLPGSPQTRSQ